jgi:hypothetical protein
MIKGLVQIVENDLKKSDKSGLKTLYLYWLENDKKLCFDLPLFVDTNGKGVMSVECFKRVFYAFCVKCAVAFDCEIVSGSDGDDGSYNVVRISASSDKCAISNDFLLSFEVPKTTDVKRESSKKTRDKSKTKKDEAKKEAEKLADDFAKSHAKKIADLVMGKYGLKLSAEKLSNLEADLIAILKM